MGNLFDSPWKVLVVAIVLIVLFGSKKLPDAARSLGKSMRILKAEVSDLHHDEPDPSAQDAPGQNQFPQAQLTPAAVPAPAERAVDVDAIGAHRERLDGLGGEDRLVHRPLSQGKILHAGGRRTASGKRMAQLCRPYARVPQFEISALPDHHGFALELGVQPQSRRKQDPARAVGRQVLLKTEQQPLPPTRLGMKARKGLDAQPHRLPLVCRVNQHAAVRMRGDNQRLAAIEQCVAMARWNSDATLGVERNDRRSMKPSTHMAFPATFPYLLPL